ncbi:hypothetical protein J4Q44_G00185980 [Coregonus suidteri]|uniref:Uncharacterized protein n=1 Tax=Coregonus suidteri TaxID=861788 RepID=A0AAN8LDS0_9TELE
MSNELRGSTSGYSLLCNQLNLKAQVDRMTEEKTVYKRRRKRGQTYVQTDAQADACQDNRDINPVQLVDCLGSGLDLFT